MEKRAAVISGVASILGALAAGGLALAGGAEWWSLASSVAGALVFASVALALTWKCSTRAQHSEPADQPVLGQTHPIKQGPQEIRAAENTRQNRVYIHRRPSELVKLLEGKTQIQAQSIAQPYIGFWVRVAGSVWEVAEKIEGIHVHIHDAHGESTAVCLQFDKAWLARLSVLSNGDWLRGSGRISSVTSHWVFLVSCEIEDINSSNHHENLRLDPLSG